MSAFHGLMLLRDEEDIIAQCLDHLLEWIDAVYVLDLGSTDRTWEIVNEYASRNRRIVPFLRRPIVYSENLRCLLFHEFRHRFRAGDWVMRIDADEFYHVLPPEFVRTRLGRRESQVYLQWYFFRLTNREVADYLSGQVREQEDRKRPIAERRLYYKISEYAEPRMFRYRPTMRWPETTSFPFNAGLLARERIPIRHYPHRDPTQMQRRCALRAAMMQLKAHGPGHWRLEDWRKEVIDLDASPDGTLEGTGGREGLSGERGIATGVLHYWRPGGALLDAPPGGHLAGGLKRVAQHCLYGGPVWAIDFTRPTFASAYAPQRIPEHVQAQLSNG